jgi:hypothetical protein
MESAVPAQHEITTIHPDAGPMITAGFGFVGVLRMMAAGAAVGATYGVALRAWMRLVSTDPGFTWSGTGYIVGAFTVLGAMAGLVTVGRRRRWRRRLVAGRGVGIVLSLGCFAGAGVLMLPTIVPAALGWARTDWVRPLRAGLLLFGGVIAVVVVITMPDLTLQRRLVALVAYLLLCTVEVAMMARLYAPSLSRGFLPGRWMVVPLVVGVALLGGFALFGIRT